MFSKLDLFGSSILLRFKGEHTYNTRFGSIFSVVIVGFIVFRLVFIIKDVFQRTSPQVIYNERQVDNPAAFEVNKFTFPLAFGMQHPISYENYIDESIYTINALWQQKKLVFNNTSQQFENIWVQEKLKILPCTPENFANEVNAHYFLKLRYESMYCLPPDLVRIIQGDFNSDIYSEIKFQMMKCTQNCKSEQEMKFFLDKATFAIQISDVFIDPNAKNDPFKSFSRNLFWDTSTQLPKDVNIFLRNNYILSDFGWVMEDIITQSFPSYSFYEYYPESYQSNYFLSVLFRMEKQKEAVYQRKYKNLNNILSEIGGFTQSLLAIGILICTRISQLHLNQEIINEAFNYQDSSEQNDVNSQDQKQSPLRQSQQSPILIQTNSNIQMFNPKTSSMGQATPQRNASPQRPIINKRHSKVNENMLQLSYVNQGQESCNVSMQQDASINQNSQFQSFCRNKQKKSISFQNVAATDQKQQSQSILKQEGTVDRDSKQILNYLIQDQQSKDMHSTHLEIIDASSPQEEKIQKLKQQMQDEEMKLKETRFKQLMDKQTKSMQMSSWEYCKSIIWPFGKLKEKKQIINYSIDKLYYNLDIFTIVKRLIEVEKLKRLLLDQDQIKLFDYLPKPTIHQDVVLKQMKDSEKKKYEVDILYQDNRTQIQKAKDAQQAYQSIKNKSSNTILDQKIINLLDPNLVAIFEAQTIKQPQSLCHKKSLSTCIQKNESIKEGSPINITPKMILKNESHSKPMQETRQMKNEDELLQQEIISPRIQIESQTILHQINLNSQLDKSTQRSSDSSEKDQQQHINIDQQLKQLDNSEIAIEEVLQHQPHQLFKSTLPCKTVYF